MKDLEKAAASVLLGEKKHLTAKQQQIDVHEPEKDELTAKDFEMLRANKKAKPMKEEQVQEVAPLVAAAGRAIATMAAKKVITTAAEKLTSNTQKEEVEQVEEARFKKGEDVGKPGMNFAKIAKSAAKKYGSKEAGQRVAGAVLKKVLAKEEYSEEEVQLIETAIEEGWEDMMKAVKERSKPQPSGGAGIKLGTRYGGGKQKEKEKEEKEEKEPVKEDIDYSFGDYLKVAKEKFGEEEAVKIANDAFNKKDISIFSNDSEA